MRAITHPAIRGVVFCKGQGPKRSADRARALAASSSRFLGGAAVTSDAEIDAFVRAKADSAYHPCCTCRMGTDADSVVDERLRVRGVTGLRVIDASIMPAVIISPL